MEEKPTDQFEISLLRLEAIVAKLENGQVGLDESVALFREGQILATRCDELLNSAERAINELVETPPVAP